MNVFQIQPGWTAYDVMAEKLGVAIEVGSTYVLVEKGPILPTDLYIPLSHVSSVNDEETNFIVDLTKDEIGTMPWQNPPADGSWEASDATRALLDKATALVGRNSAAITAPASAGPYPVRDDDPAKRERAALDVLALALDSRHAPPRVHGWTGPPPEPVRLVRW